MSGAESERMSGVYGAGGIARGLTIVTAREHATVGA
jgi:hypothetical protein